MPDGTIYAGVSPDTGRAMFALPKDVPMHCNFNQASDYVTKLSAHNYWDWRVPTKSELDLLFRNRAVIRGFDTSGSIPSGWYWSAERNHFGAAWSQRFSDGRQLGNLRFVPLSLRCVRG
jgi:hypothetical protein